VQPSEATRKHLAHSVYVHRRRPAVRNDRNETIDDGRAISGTKHSLRLESIDVDKAGTHRGERGSYRGATLKTMRRFPQPTPTWVFFFDFLLSRLARRDPLASLRLSRAPKAGRLWTAFPARPMTITGRRLSERGTQAVPCPCRPKSSSDIVVAARNSIPCDGQPSSDDPFVTRGGTGLRFAIGTRSIEFRRLGCVAVGPRGHIFFEGDRYINQRPRRVPRGCRSDRRLDMGGWTWPLGGVVLDQDLHQRATCKVRPPPCAKA